MIWSTSYEPPTFHLDRGAAPDLHFCHVSEANNIFPQAPLSNPSLSLSFLVLTIFVFLNFGAAEIEVSNGGFVFIRETLKWQRLIFDRSIFVSNGRLRKSMSCMQSCAFHIIGYFESG
ncbi:hypothetical protein PanWU01x14_139120 [Parasponia andersonii]|uniref:Uncharacterized protein n=1 Tax=Parasponia andersonii TaxID=3476 RepID=A0A2P5CMV7_PARAD|nr:hypothetical protein PanWU01x14_139120 [Parasponia andersonii]